MTNAVNIDTGFLDEYTEMLKEIYPWHGSNHPRKDIHPAVLAAFDIAQPVDWTAVAFGWPHRPLEDENRLAYTQDIAKGDAGRATVTSIGKYLKKHWPSLADHTIREIVDKCTVTGVEIYGTAEAIIGAAQHGPYSCMQWGDTNPEDHPYSVYAPALGWAIAIRKQGAEIVSRALLYTGDRGCKCFVRTYAKAVGSTSYSQRDTKMEAHLVGQGYSHRRGWPDGAALAKVYTGKGPADHLLPYLDGDNTCVTDAGDTFMIASEDAGYCCDRTDGTCSRVVGDTYCYCADCGEGVEQDEACGTGVDSEHIVCNGCAERHYTMVTGRRRREYFILDTEAIVVNNEGYDPDYLEDNDIVSLESGDYAELDDAFVCAVDGEYYLCEEAREVQDKPDEMVHESNTWVCEVSDEWYSTDTCSVIDSEGRTVHPDALICGSQVELELDCP